MHYPQSLTTSVSRHIETVLAQKIMTANSHQQFGSTAGEIRQYLSDPATVSTLDFVLRRYLQNNHPQLLEEYPDLPDLTTSGKNIPWDSKVIRALSLRLEKLSISQGAKIEAKEWRNYLSGKGVKKREKAFMVAFVLQMGVEDTMELLLSLGMEPYSVRYPLDLICMFCQEHPGTFSWSEAEAMYQAFLERKQTCADTEPAPNPGMTEQITVDLKQLFDRNLQHANACEALVEYMAANSREFVSCKKAGKEMFLPGYSLHRIGLYQRLAEYLAVIYPTYTVPVNQKDGEEEDLSWDPKPWNVRTKPVIGEDGVLSLTALTKAMFNNGLWSDIIWNPGAGEGAFEKTMRNFCVNYGKHMMAVERMKKGGNNVAFFDRRDALVWIYFLISGYLQVCAGSKPEDHRKAEVLKDMAFGEQDFDMAVEEVLDKVECELSDPDEDDPVGRFRCLCECFNMILAQLGYQNLYMPAQFDRFILLSLLAEDPAELSTVLMSQMDWEYYYGDTVTD